MSAKKARQSQLKYKISQNKSNSAEIIEIDKLEKLIDDSLIEIQFLQEELKDLEQDLNNFLDHHYGPVSSFFKNNSVDPHADNDNGVIADLSKAKKDLYEKIARVCSQEALSFAEHHAHSDLLNIEGYLTDGTNQSQSPHDLLSNLAFEYYSLMQQIRDLKNKKKNLLDSPAYELKQQVMWTNIRTAETISKIKDDITHQMNKPN